MSKSKKGGHFVTFGGVFIIECFRWDGWITPFDDEHMHRWDAYCRIIKEN